MSTKTYPVGVALSVAPESHAATIERMARAMWDSDNPHYPAVFTREQADQLWTASRGSVMRTAYVRRAAAAYRAEHEGGARPSPIDAPRGGGPWTRHGHPIPGITIYPTPPDAPLRPPVAQCGGVHWCTECRADAGEHGYDVPVTTPPPPPGRTGIWAKHEGGAA